MQKIENNVNFQFIMALKYYECLISVNIGKLSKDTFLVLFFDHSDEQYPGNGKVRLRMHYLCLGDISSSIDSISLTVKDDNFSNISE